jgi:VWFA-related protein
MLLRVLNPRKQLSRWIGRLTVIALAVALYPTIGASLHAQDSSSSSSSQSQSGQSQSGQSGNNGNKQASPGEAGGPTGDVGPMAIPQKRQEAPPPPPPKPKTPENMPEYSIRVDVPLVTVPVSVFTQNGQFIPGLKPGNFRIYEDGTPQKILTAAPTEAGITAVMLVEFAHNNYAFMYDALNASYVFANSLKKDDWVAVVSFDLKPHILVDFTQDKGAVYAALNNMMMAPAFSEVNVYDALYDTLDRIQGVDGRKYIVLISSGCDTFSKTNFDTVLKKVKASSDTVIYPVSTGKAFLVWAEAQGYGQAGQSIGPCSDNMDFLAADAQMKAYAQATGGQWYAPRFEGELPEIFGNIAANIRNQYTISYRPTNTKQDGTYRKLKVEVVAPDGGPLKVRDQKGKDVKYTVQTRDGYTAKREVE